LASISADDSEPCSVSRTAGFGAALDALRRDALAAVVTRSEKGAIFVSKDVVIETPAERIARLVDTTGAGDLFAAGFLFGRARGMDERICLRLGAIAAAQIIQHVGARPLTSLRATVEQAGLKI